MGRRRQQSKRRRLQRPKFAKAKNTAKWIDRCWCGKIIFPDELTADMALTRGAGRKGSIRSYECDVVPGNWHTTSKPLR